MVLFSVLGKKAKKDGGGAKKRRGVEILPTVTPFSSFGTSWVPAIANGN